MKKIFIVTAALIIFFNPPAFPQSYLNSPTKLQEKFVYDVDWLFVHLGTITMNVESFDSFPDLIKVIVKVKTASALPFINIDEYNVAVLRLSDGMTIYYHGTEELDGRNADVTYVYDDAKKNSVYTLRTLSTKELIKSDTIKITEPYLIGTSLIEYARIAADSGLVKNVPTLIKGKFYPTIINYCGPVEDIDIDACDYSVSAFRYEGNADWGGNAVAGLSGEYTGWLSNDDAKVVLRAEMKITLGSIDVELEQWYKPGWIPPARKKYYAGFNN
jgi:hypothetical protein